MRPKTILAASATAALGLALLAAPSLAADRSESAAMLRGQQLAQRNCSVCHAIGLRGVSPNKDAPPFREMHRRYPADSLEEAFRRGLLSRHPSMPEFRFLPQELMDLTAYLKSLRGAGQAQAATGRSPS